MNESNSDHVSTVSQNNANIKTDKVSVYKDEENANPNHDLKPVTKAIKKDLNLKRHYVNTTNEQRLELIEAVCKNGERVKSAAHRLGINYSAAKAICQVYKSEGRSMKKPPRRRTPSTWKIKENSFDNTSPLKILPITIKKEYDDGKDANRMFISPRILQLMKKPLPLFPKVQKPLNPLNLPFSNPLIIPQRSYQYQNLMQNPLVQTGLPSNAQQSLGHLSVIGLPVISSQIHTSNIFVMFPPQISSIPSQPIANVNGLSVLTNPLYNTLQYNNFQPSSLSLSVPNYRFLC